MHRLVRTAAFVLPVAVVNTVCAFNPAVGDFSKPPGDVIRVLSWNVHNNFIYTTDDDGRYMRVIKAVNPDVIAFQEIEFSLTAAQIKTRLESYFPGSEWYIHLGKADGSVVGVNNRNVIASRYPLFKTGQDTVPTSDIRGVCMAMVNLPSPQYAKNFYVMSIHFKAGNEDTDVEKRQKHADALSNWMRDARTDGGSIDMAANTPMLIAGDTNLPNRGDKVPWHPGKTLLDGTIFNTARYGSSTMPDWDGTTLADASPYDYSTGFPWTHNSSDPGVRIDRFYYTDSCATYLHGCVINTRTMSAVARTAAGGLQTNDTSGASDHLPIMADFSLGADPRPPAQLVLNEYNANDVGTDDRTFLEIKNIGGREVNLRGPVEYALKESDPLPASPPSSENEQYNFELAGVVPPGGLFVIYDSAGHGSALKTQIESRLPALQRQDLAGFVMDNDNNSAIALIQRTWTRFTVSKEDLVEAYGWGTPNPNQPKYFMTNSGNDLLINMGSNQWTSFYSSGGASDLTVARSASYTELNNYDGWIIGGAATPGLENPALSDVNDWALY